MIDFESLIYRVDLNIYLPVKKLCYELGLSDRQAKEEIIKISRDPLLAISLEILKIKNNEGKRIVTREVKCIQLKYLPIWLSRINSKSLNEEQYKNVINTINWSLSSDFDNLKTPTKIYSFESELRNEIFENGYLGDIKITNKEVVYDFGRTDLEGTDNKNNKYVIELKKYKEYNDVIEQCKRYREGFKGIGEDVRIIICQYDCSSIKEEAAKNGFECYEYRRELKLKKII